MSRFDRLSGIGPVVSTAGRELGTGLAFVKFARRWSRDCRQAAAALAAVSALLVQMFVTASVPAWSATGGPLRIVVLGDSLAAGLGLAPEAAFPAQLQARMRADGRNVEVINAGVSGDTTAAGLERLDWAVPGEVDAVIVELGANDALRGIDPTETARNLDTIVKQLTARGLPVLVAGMRSPANWGDDYRRRYDPIFADVAKRYGALLHPFLLEGVAMEPALNQADGMHPNAKGVVRMVEAIAPVAGQLAARASARRAAAGNN